MVHVPVSYRWLSALSAAFAAPLLGASVAQAHIELSEPIARYEVSGETGIKGCPCGMATGGGNSNRTCKVAMDGSDVNRDETRAYTAAAGSTLVLKFKETVGHTGKYRVAFDPDGADFDDFNANVLTEVDDPQGSTGNTNNGNNWEIEVTLPEMSCTTCTLQLIQVMDASTLGGTVDGSKLASMSTYYTCVDLVLTGGGADTGDTGAGDTFSSGAETGSSMSLDSASSFDSAASSDVATTTTATPGTPPVVAPPPAIVPPPPALPPTPPSPATPPAVPVTPGTTTSAPTTTAAPSTTAPTTTAPTTMADASGEKADCSVANHGGAANGGNHRGLVLACLAMVVGLGVRRRAR